MPFKVIPLVTAMIHLLGSTSSKQAPPVDFASLHVERVVVLRPVWHEQTQNQMRNSSEVGSWHSRIKRHGSMGPSLSVNSELKVYKHLQMSYTRTLSRKPSFFSITHAFWHDLRRLGYSSIQK